jgi:uncharacterized RDD family membrane protein YckC
MTLQVLLEPSEDGSYTVTTPFYFLAFLAFLAPCLVAFFNPMQRALHDMMFSTVVVNRDSI